jgi:hypothetical protein
MIFSNLGKKTVSMIILLKLRFGFTNSGLMLKVPIYNMIFHKKKHGKDPRKWLNSSVMDPSLDPVVDPDPSLFVRIRNWILILPSLCKNIKRSLYFYCFVTSS